MTFDDILEQALDILQRRGRVSYRALKRQDWLTKADFVDFERIVLPDAFSFIRARKPA